MKIKLNDILIVAFIIGLSIILKYFFWIPLALAAVTFLFSQKLDPGIKNLLYLSIATLPFIPFTVFFLFYLPFMVFGALSPGAGFIKKLLIGFAVTHLFRLIPHFTSVLGIPISPLFIAVLLIGVLILAYTFYIKKHSVKKIPELFVIKPVDFKILIITLFFFFMVAHVLFTPDSLYQANATQIYAKQLFVINNIAENSFFPLYDPGTGMGEELFLTDSPVHFTKDILIMATVWMKPWFNEILIYNTYSMFIVWMVILGAALVGKEALSIYGQLNSKWSVYFVILAALSVGLSFQFVRILESFKSFSAHPLNLLLIAMLLSKPKKPSEFFLMAYLMLMSYLVHVIQAIGVFFVVAVLFVMMYVRDAEAISQGWHYFMRNKGKVILVMIVFIGVMFSYTAIGASYGGYVREHHTGLFQPDTDLIVPNIITYVTDYTSREHVSPFSIEYPNPTNLGTKKSGFFLSVVGVIAFIYLLINWKDHRLKKGRILAWMFVIQFILYDIFTMTFNVGNLEPGYRIIHPYTVLLLAISIAVVFDSVRNNMGRAALVVVFLAFFLHSTGPVQETIQTLHSESIISGNVLASEVNFIQQLPIDARIITYGLFSNAVDAGLYAVTDRYFTRYQYNLWSEINNIYHIIHTQHSFGEFPELAELSGQELSNYLRLGGYKYVFMNIGHPVSQQIVQKVFPDFTFGLYQNQALVFLQVNGTNYAEKVSVLDGVDPELYKTEDGYKLYTISDLERYPTTREEGLAYANTEVSEPEPLSWQRINAHTVLIPGDFEQDEWVVFKEEYFPRWKAFMGEKEVPVYPSNFNMMLIKADKGRDIMLRYEYLPHERIVTIISLLGVLACSVLFLAQIRWEF